MVRHFGSRRIAAFVAVGAVAAALTLAGASAAQASNASSAAKLEAQIQSLRAVGSIDPFHRNTLVDAWLEKGLKKYAAHPTTNFSTDLGAPPQGPAGYSPFVIKITHPTIAKALAALETYDDAGLLDVSASFGPAGWVTKGSSAYIGFSTVIYAQLPWQKFGKVTLPSHAVTGETIKAKPSGWSPTPSSYTFAWSIDGGATSFSADPEIVVASTAVGHRITLTVTPVLSGFQTPPSASAKTGHSTGLGTIHAPHSLVVTGTRAYGDTLTVSVGDWKPALVGWSYQWYRNGHPISGALLNYYTVAGDDVGKRIDVKVTGSLPGFHSASVETHTTKKATS